MATVHGEFTPARSLALLTIRAARLDLLYSRATYGLAFPITTKAMVDTVLELVKRRKCH